MRSTPRGGSTPATSGASTARVASRSRAPQGRRHLADRRERLSGRRREAPGRRADVTELAIVGVEVRGERAPRVPRRPQGDRDARARNGASGGAPGAIDELPFGQRPAIVHLYDAPCRARRRARSSATRSARSCSAWSRRRPRPESGADASPGRARPSPPCAGMAVEEVTHARVAAGRARLRLADADRAARGARGALRGHRSAAPPGVRHGGRRRGARRQDARAPGDARPRESRRASRAAPDRAARARAARRQGADRQAAGLLLRRSHEAARLRARAHPAQPQRDRGRQPREPPRHGLRAARPRQVRRGHRVAGCAGLLLRERPQASLLREPHEPQGHRPQGVAAAGDPAGERGDRAGQDGAHLPGGDAKRIG